MHHIPIRRVQQVSWIPVRLRMFAVLVAGLAALVTWTAVGARAATTWTVNKKGDVAAGSCPAVCTLRHAVSAAAAGDTIVVPKGNYTVSRGAILLPVSVVIKGAGASQVTIDGGAKSQIFQIQKAVTASISGLTLTNGFRDGNGGAILSDGNLTLSNSVVSKSRALGDGGGIFSDGTLDLINSTVSGNTSAGGGGLFNSGSLTISGSTVSGNAANGPGGGLDEEGRQADSITNSTITGNTVSGSSGANGGGIYDANSTAGLTGINDTIVGNSAPDGANVYFADLGVGGLQNTIVADPLGRGNNCDNTVGEPPSLGNNIEDTPVDTCNFTALSDRVGVNPKLGALGSNGGPTQTMALLAGSPAINHAALVKSVKTDQRGGPRPVGSAPDIGAYEYAALIDLGLAGNAPTPARVGRHLVYTLRATNDGPTPDVAQGVMIVSRLPATIQFVSATPAGCAHAGGSNQVVCSLGTLARGASRTVHIVVSPTAVGSFSSKATVSSGGADHKPSNDHRTLTVTVQDVPAAVTNLAGPVHYRGATLHGSVNAENAPTTYWFEYGNTTAYGSKTPAVTMSGVTAHSVVKRLGGLKPGELYHYRVVAQNALGTVNGVDRTFFTPYLPVVHVDPARVKPGERIHVYGSVGECPMGSGVTVVSKAFSDAHTYHGDGAIYTTVGRGGEFSIRTRIPASRKARPYKISALCGHFP